MKTTSRVIMVTGFALGLAAFGGVSLAQPADANEPDVVQNAELPDGFELIDRANEATGGKDRYAKMKATKYAGSFRMEVPGFPQAIEGTIQILRAAPNKQRVLVELGPLGSVDQGTDGKVAWAVQPGAPVQMLQGDALADAIRQADFYERAKDPREVRKSAKTMGIVEIDGKPCYEVVVEDKDGSVYTEYFDQETGLAARRISDDQTTVYETYEEFDGMTLPTKMRFIVKSPQGEIERVMMFTTVEIDPELPADTFEAPGSF